MCRCRSSSPFSPLQVSSAGLKLFMGADFPSQICLGWLKGWRGSEVCRDVQLQPTLAQHITA